MAFGPRMEDWQTTVPIDSMVSLIDTGAPEGPPQYYGNPSPIQQTPGDPFFGTMLNTLRDNLVDGGSELGLGMMLFSLAVSIRAKTILEIGRHRGFSTFALASALRFLDHGWDEAPNNRQRPDIDYTQHEARVSGHLFSIDIIPNPAAEELINAHGLGKYVQYVNQDSKICVPTDMYDIMLIDGDHTYLGCLADVQNFVPKYLRPGGYFILHDWFGWYDNMGVNNSPIKAVGEFMGPEFERVLIDTGYQSFKIFRKQNLYFPSPQVIAQAQGTSLPTDVVDLNTSNGVLAEFTAPQILDAPSYHG